MPVLEYLNLSDMLHIFSRGNTASVTPFQEWQVAHSRPGIPLWDEAHGAT